MNQPAPSPSPIATQLRRRRAADEILIAAIYGLSERDDAATTVSRQRAGDPLHDAARRRRQRPADEALDRP